ncbi:MAG: DUF4418 family protein [Dehalococcoidales bacterium]|nr:DUF4418 family protein [Dehalococcoidales bacterium]
MNKLLGAVLVVLALAIAIIPAYTDCQSQGKSLTLANGKTVPMKCHWTGVSEIAVGAPLFFTGLLAVFNRRKQNLFSLGLLAAVLGVLAILLPNKLIGVCQTTMLCNTVMQPALTVMGSVVILGGAGMMLFSRKGEE